MMNFLPLELPLLIAVPMFGMAMASGPGDTCLEPQSLDLAGKLLVKKWPVVFGHESGEDWNYVVKFDKDGTYYANEEYKGCTYCHGYQWGTWKTCGTKLFMTGQGANCVMPTPEGEWIQSLFSSMWEMPDLEVAAGTGFTLNAFGGGMAWEIAEVSNAALASHGNCNNRDNRNNENGMSETDKKHGRASDQPWQVESCPEAQSLDLAGKLFVKKWPVVFGYESGEDWNYAVKFDKDGTYYANEEYKGCVYCHGYQWGTWKTCGTKLFMTGQGTNCVMPIGNDEWVPALFSSMWEMPDLEVAAGTGFTLNAFGGGMAWEIAEVSNAALESHGLGPTCN
jgi:hypothetical protein